jgi:CHAT domain-containing protein/tetratricopeptide (TPR) repeat protein
MNGEEYCIKSQALYQKLDQARCLKDKDAEIEVLMQIGDLAAQEKDLSPANKNYYLAAKAIQDFGTGFEMLHKALGERALVLKRMKRYAEALDLYKQAEEAARKYAGAKEYAHWIGKQGNIYRLMGEMDLAQRQFQNSLDLFRTLNEEGFEGAADQEGNLGLLANTLGDNEKALEAYSRAVELAQKAGSPGAINTWATNLGNALSGKRKYHEAWIFYEKAMKAATQSQNEDEIVATATDWSVSYRRAHQSEQAAETLIKASEKINDVAKKFGFLTIAMDDLNAAGAWTRMIEIGKTMTDFMIKRGEKGAYLDKYINKTNFARKMLQEEQSASTLTADQVKLTSLDLFVPANMERYEKSNNTSGIVDIAHLICDINLGLINPTEEAWKPILSQSHLRYRVVGEAIIALCKEGKAEKSLELSQRMKSLGFCSLNIERMRMRGPPHEEAAEYLAAINELSQVVGQLRGPPVLDVLKRVQAVRAAGELVLECGEGLRNRDRILHAKTGGLIRPQDLLNAFPIYDPIAIVDFFVTNKGTMMHILIREKDKVQTIPFFSPHFTLEHAIHLLRIWLKNDIIHEISDRQRQGLIEIGKILHDKLFCSLANYLNQLNVKQVILIPDVFTSCIPLHLATVCQDLKIPGVDTADALFFSEFFPTEYAPCLQAVAVSQHKKRPREVKSILSFDDPLSDLPGARNTANWLTSQLPKEKYLSYVGKQATIANLTLGISKADIALIGTHGHFDVKNPTESYLAFFDGRWKMNDILDNPVFENSPVLILSSCEVGASTPLAELTLGGLPSGIPGALLSSGAACTLASLWPVEDISMEYLVEKFLTHLAHPGYRPSAALFRAIKDLKELTKKEALNRCCRLIEQMEQDGTADLLPEQFIRLDALKVWIEDSEDDHPFKSPQFWGGIIIFGSGWHLPAGALVGAQDIRSTINVIESIQRRQEATELMVKGKFQEAREILEQLQKQTEGVENVRTLDKLAWAVWMSRQRGSEESAKQEALRLLDQAEFLAQGEQSQQLMRNIKATKQKIELAKSWQNNISYSQQ